MPRLPALPRPALFVALSLLAACQDTDLPPAPSGLAPQAFNVPLDRSDTLAGADQNLNGVRDDVERWLDTHPLPDPARLALLRYAQMLQQSVLSTAQDAERALALTREQASAYACLLANDDLRAHAPAWSHRLRQITANTEARIRAHLGYAAALDGRSWTLPAEDDCNAS